MDLCYYSWGVISLEGDLKWIFDITAEQYNFGGWLKIDLCYYSYAVLNSGRQLKIDVCYYSWTHTTLEGDLK